MEQKYKDELNQAFREFIRTLDNAKENVETKEDREFIDDVIFDLNEKLKDM